MTATLTVGPSNSKSILDTYMLYVYQTAVYDTSIRMKNAIQVEIGNGRCDPDFNGPDTTTIDDEYEYVIGEDINLVIKFKDANNGNCFFKSKLDIDGPTESVARYQP